MPPVDLGPDPLLHLLELWRERRDPRLSRLVTALGEKVAAAPPTGLDKLKPTALGKAIIDKLATIQPAELHHFFPHAERFVRTGKAGWPVIELMAELPADPRIADMALRLLRDFEKLPHTSAKLARRLIDMVEHHGDSATGEALAQVPLPEWFGASPTRVANVRKRLAAGTPLPDRDVDDLGEAVASCRAGPAAALPKLATPTDDELLEAIHRDPTDDTALLVYADLLAAQGNPRGELIHLQLARATGTLSAAGKKRESALLKAHFRSWIAQLLPVLESWGSAPPRDLDETECSVGAKPYAHCTFSRGFLYRVQGMKDVAHRRSVLDDPIWSTVARLEYATAFSSAMKSLRRARCGPDALATITTLPQPLAVLEIELSRAVADPKLLAGRCPTRDLQLAVSSGPGTVRSCLRGATTDNPTIESITMNGSDFADWSRSWDWTVLDDAPAALTRVDLQIASGERMLLERTDGKWSKGTFAGATIPRALMVWEQVLEPFRERRLDWLWFSAAPGSNMQHRGALVELLQQFGDSVEVTETVTAE